MARTAVILRAVPLGRLDDMVRNRPDADRLALAPNGWDYDVYRYPSRASMLAFCRRGPQSAVVKDAVHPTMLLYPNVQRAEAALATRAAREGGASA